MQTLIRIIACLQRQIISGTKPGRMQPGCSSDESPSRKSLCDTQVRIISCRSGNKMGMESLRMNLLHVWMKNWFVFWRDQTSKSGYFLHVRMPYMPNQWRPRGRQHHLLSTVPRSMMIFNEFHVLQKHISGFISLIKTNTFLIWFDGSCHLFPPCCSSGINSKIIFVVRFFQSNYILVTLTCRQPVNVVGVRLAYALLWITFDTSCWFLKIHDTLIRFSILCVVKLCKRSAPTFAVKLQAKHSISFRKSFLSTSTGKTDYWKQKNS